MSAYTPINKIWLSESHADGLYNICMRTSFTSAVKGLVHNIVALPKRGLKKDFDICSDEEKEWSHVIGVFDLDDLENLRDVIERELVLRGR